VLSCRNDHGAVLPMPLVDDVKEHGQRLGALEIYFSVVEGKILTLNDVATLAVLEPDLLAFQHRYQARAQPFRWTSTRADLHRLLAKLAVVRPAACRKIRHRNSELGYQPSQETIGADREKGKLGADADKHAAPLAVEHVEVVLLDHRRAYSR
jgi:hypothetical protein